MTTSHAKNFKAFEYDSVEFILYLLAIQQCFLQEAFVSLLLLTQVYLTAGKKFKSYLEPMQDF